MAPMDLMQSIESHSLVRAELGDSIVLYIFLWDLKIVKTVIEQRSSVDATTR